MRDFLRVYRRTHNVKDRQCTYKHNIEARSCNHFCCGKAISTYSEWVFVAFVIQHAKRIRRVMSSMACPAVQYFSTLSHKRHEKTKKKKNGKITEHQMCVVILSTTFVCETFLILKRTDRDINVYKSSYKVPGILFSF